MFSLLLPLKPTYNTSTKFEFRAVNVNKTDNITQKQIKTLRNILSEFFTLWENRIEYVIEPKNDWMKIPFKERAVIEFKGRYKVFKWDENATNEVFDRAIQDEQMFSVHDVVSAGWHVFVVWNKEKAWFVVNLRDLNKIVVWDSYPLSY